MKDAIILLLASIIRRIPGGKQFSPSARQGVVGSKKLALQLQQDMARLSVCQSFRAIAGQMYPQGTVLLSPNLETER